MGFTSNAKAKPPAEAELTGWLELPSGHRVRVRMTVFEEPLFPTPNEPEVTRVPLVTEWARIVGKMARMEFTRMEGG